MSGILDIITGGGLLPYVYCKKLRALAEGLDFRKKVSASHGLRDVS